MPEMGTSGLMSGDGKRGGAQSSVPASILDSTGTGSQHIRFGKLDFVRMIDIRFCAHLRCAQTIRIPFLGRTGMSWPAMPYPLLFQTLCSSASCSDYLGWYDSAR